MTAEQKATKYYHNMEDEVSCGMYFDNKFRDGYLAGYNEATRWISFGEEKPFIHDYILVRTNLYPLVKPRVKRVTSRVDLSKKYSHWKAI